MSNLGFIGLGIMGRQDRGLRRLMSRTKKGRDALRSSEAHPQARSIAPPRSKRSQRRVPISRHRPKSEETGKAHPSPGADLRHMRRRAPIPPPDGRRNRYPLPSAEGFFNTIDVKRTSKMQSKARGS